MEFYTIVNANNELIAPAFKSDYKEGKEPQWVNHHTPVLFELFYDTAEKVREYYWGQYKSLDWAGIKMRKIKIEFID